MQKLTGPTLAPLSGKAKQMVIFLHGYGSSGDDLIAIGEQWHAALPDCVFASPNAPSVCDQWAQGFQWFGLRAINREAIEEQKPMEAVAPILNNYIDEQLLEWGVTQDKLVVVGFSQGAMMAMYTMPRRKNPCAGVIGYSGMLLDAAGLKTAPSKMPVLIVHGERDDVVPPHCLSEADEGFSAAGFNVETILRPGMGHSIDHFGMMRGLDFVRECFDNADQSGSSAVKA